MSAKTGQGKMFYGWWVVIGGFFLMATCYTPFVNCMALFQTHLVGDLNITMTQYTTGLSLCTVMAVFSSLAIGKLVDKMSVRILGTFTVVVTFVSLLLLSAITQLWQFYALCVLAGLVVVAGTRMLVSVIITNWFTLRRGLAVAIALTGSGAGGVVLTQVTKVMIAGYGWRPAFQLLAVIALVCSLPFVIGVFRNHPSQKGLEPYGYGQVEQAKEDNSPDLPVTVSVGWKIVRKNLGFWLLIIGFVMMGIDNGAIINNMVANATSVPLTSGSTVVTGGHSEEWAANVFTLYMAVVIVAKILLGHIYDRRGLKAGTVLGTVVSFLAAIALCFSGTDWGPVLAAVFFGFGTCMGTVAPPVMAVKEFGKKDIGMITGVVTAFEMFGAAIGSVLSGVLFDAFSSFVPVWIMVMVATAFMGITLLASVPLAKQLVEKREAEGAPRLDADGNDIVADVVTVPDQSGVSA